MTPINKMRNEGREVTTDTKDMQINMRHYKKLYADKLEHLEEIDKFLETSPLPKLNQEEIENLKRPAISNEIESVIKKPNKQKFGTRRLHR